eukprot:m.73083 g.73083  ORF g.73083 m.73083 type:complete len:503 (-) comp14305_c0_seq2:1263-2771(-)
MWRVVCQGLKLTRSSGYKRVLCIQRFYNHTKSIRVTSCQGCGAGFQHDFVNQPGYISSAAFEKKLLQLDQWHNRGDGLVKLDGNPSETLSLLNNDELLNIEEGLDDAMLQRFAQQPGKKPSLPPVLCQRCHRLNHYGQVEAAHDTFKQSIEQLHAKFTNLIYVLVVDMADFPAGIAPELITACQGRAIIVVNKLDLLVKRLKGPNSINQFKAKVRRTAQQLGLEVEDVFLTSTRTRFGLDTIFKSLLELSTKKQRNVVLLGASNAGKSSLLNQISSSKQQSTVSATSATTQGLMVYQFDELYGDPIARPTDIAQVPDSVEDLTDAGTVGYLIDTPGFLNTQQLFTHVPVNASMQFLAQTINKPRFVHLNPGQSVVLGCFGSIACCEGSDPFRLGFTMAQGITLHRTKTNRVTSLLASKGHEDWLAPPATVDDLATLEQEVHEFSFTASPEERVFEIAIGGVGHCLVVPHGWQKTAQLTLTVPKGVLVIQTLLFDQFLRREKL